MYCYYSHLRNHHCSREGGSFVCLYGENRVCSSLPVEGVSDSDYERHIYKHHIFDRNKYQRHKRQASIMSTSSDQSLDEKWNVYSASQNLAAVLNNPNKIKQVCFRVVGYYCEIDDRCVICKFYRRKTSLRSNGVKDL